MDDKMSNASDWSKWENHILAEIKRLAEAQERTADSQIEMTMMVGSIKEDFVRVVGEITKEVELVKQRLTGHAALAGFAGAGVLALIQWAISKIAVH